MKLELSLQIFEKYTNIKFQENPSSGSRVVPSGRTDGQMERRTATQREGWIDMTKLIIVFLNFAEVLKNNKHL
jgi:hypothetical protein